MASSPAQYDALKKLEYLSLVSKVSSELESHVGFADKVLAEFMTDMGRHSHTVDEFDAKLKENGAELPDYFVRTLLTIIHAILPPKPKAADKDSKAENTGDGKKSKFKALAIANDKDRAKELEKEIELEMRDREDKDKDGDRDRDTDRDRDRDRDGDRDRSRHRDRYKEEEEDRRDYGNRGRNRDRTWDTEDDRDYRNRDRDNVERDEDGGRRSNGKYRDNELELYKVYKGRVSRVMNSIELKLSIELQISSLSSILIVFGLDSTRLYSYFESLRDLGWEKSERDQLS